MYQFERYLTRYACYTDIQDALIQYDSESKNCLSISDSIELAKVAGLSKTNIINQNYPDCDLNKLAHQNETLDFIVSDFVIEHANTDPLNCFSEQARVLKKGGHLVCTTAFVYMYHECPVDLWRFSKDTYHYLCKRTGLEVVKTGSWGDINCLLAIHNGRSNEIVPMDVNHELYKMAIASYPIVTWLIAKKTNK